MKLYLVLERSNLFETDGKKFDFSKDLITYRETIYNKEIEKLSSNEIEKFKHNVFESMKYPFPRNGFEYIKDKGQESLNVLILDYSLEKAWEKDVNVKSLINYIASYFEVNEYSAPLEILDMSHVGYTLEIDYLGHYESESLEYLQNLFDEYKIEYRKIYEKTSQINVGASGGSIKVIFEIITAVKDITTVIGLFKKKYPHNYDFIQSHNINKVKKQISEDYKIHESQLELESIDYNDEKRETIYIFESRKYRYYIVYDKGKLKSSYREKKNN